MQGRVENKIKTEKRIQRMISGGPDYLKKYYYSVNPKTHATKLRYITHVMRFLTHLGNGDMNSVDIDALSLVDQSDIARYMDEIGYIETKDGVKEMSQATRANVLSSICSFMTFLKRNNYIDENPFDNGIIERPKINDGEVVFLTPEEVKETEKCITDAENGLWKYRDYLLFRIPVVNGLRVTALSEINVEDINIDDKSIRVTEKGNVTKKVYFDEKTLVYLKRWLDDRKTLLRRSGVSSKSLFISSRYDRISVRGIEKIIKKYTEKSVPYKHITPHKLRSTCGTNLYQAKKDIYLVASVLGHKSTVPTQRYTKVFDTDKREAIDVMGSIYS